MGTVTLSLQELQKLAEEILVAHETSAANAAAVAAALVAAEADGLAGHGASRIPPYAAQARAGKVDGRALPVLEQAAPAALRVDARDGFAYPALDLAIGALADLAPRTGIAAAAITNSHHSGVAGLHVEPLAERGLIGLSFGNSPQAIAPWGGHRGLFGANAMAFGAPRGGDPPLVIDMSLSKVTRGKVYAAAQKGEEIPEGWALDRDGKPTRDPEAAMAGTMVPMGGAKVAQLVLMVEILAAALTGSCFGYEASSFFSAEGGPPRVGQFLIAIDPGPLSDNTLGPRLEALIETILDQAGTRLPGSRRLQLREAAVKDGVELAADLHDKLVVLRDGTAA